MGQGERSYTQSRLMCITLDALHTIAARVHNYVGTACRCAPLLRLCSLRSPAYALRAMKSPSPSATSGGATRAAPHAIRTNLLFLRPFPITRKGTMEQSSLFHTPSIRLFLRVKPPGVCYVVRLYSSIPTITAPRHPALTISTSTVF